MPYKSLETNTYEVAMRLSDETMKSLNKMIAQWHIESIGLYPEYIEQNEKVTVVHWTDKTVTSVICGEGETDNIYSAFAHAVVKKLFGGTNAVHRVVDTHMVEYINNKKAEERQKKMDEQRELQERNHRRKIKSLAKRLANLEEAKRLLNEKADVHGDA